MKHELRNLVAATLMAAVLPAQIALAFEPEEDPAAAGAVLTQEIIDLIVASGLYPNAEVLVGDLCPSLAPSS